MKCPVDGETLLMSDRNGVEIDYCPRCRGVWLDRGELDKIIERSAVTADAASPGARASVTGRERPSSRDDRDRRDDDRRDHKEHRDGKDRYRKSWKRDSFLKELFDFD